MATKTENVFDIATATQAIARELGLPPKQVQSAVELLDAGNTIPFIARYRKEATGGLDEIALRAIEDALEKAMALAARKTTVLKTIDEQGLLTAALRKQIEQCPDLATLEAIYLPYKPKRRTRATIARERGLAPLAELLLSQSKLGKSKDDVLKAFVDAAKDVPDADAALQGALDIVAEQWSEDAPTRTWMSKHAFSQGRITSSIKRGKKDQAEKFEQYVDHQESANRIPGHRLLAMMRGESEGVLKVGIQLEDSQVLAELKPKLVPNRDFEFRNELLATVEDCYQRLLMPATESTVMQALKEKADEEAIAVFGKNLRELLMSAPAGPRVTIGIDPGFRTGCKVAVVDGTGKFLTNTTIYPTPPKSDTAAAGKALLALIQKHDVELIAIGNGTASRETDSFVGDLIREHKLAVTKVMVSESGASIYSASELASKEFPDLDITVRGAISIARRLQDPLAELVKSDPKSIGVGQYQHDVNQTQLRKCLDRTVESCVNNVGVDLNMASVPLLSYVAGIGPKLAANIVEYRDQNGQFKNRKELGKVPKLGKKAFEQAAGFLRIRGGDEPLDNSAVHPESYPVVSRMAKKLGADSHALVGNASLSQKLQPSEFVDDRFGLPTVADIIAELGKPGRDPRSEFRAVKFDDSVNCMEDLKPGMVLEGVITNVTHFGAFIDIGVHQDGLIHISQLANTFVQDPNEVVAVGDVTKVKVLEIDLPRKRISVTRKF
ncbi:30S ribosomal protein S1 [Novipirellula galeiformis]|uniref:30S ribosomal protein S1 n=1 Tax=Novipirellula galeiformis TaxID=2528004 RepID=A0A5C6CKK7_9BACT|nr:Tex family protein [Novipirellula galeiformis]TWU24952.1 30S ribosomal protein S1 [Novipirellula galeiformis]